MEKTVDASPPLDEDPCLTIPTEDLIRSLVRRSDGFLMVRKYADKQHPQKHDVRCFLKRDVSFPDAVMFGGLATAACIRTWSRYHPEETPEGF